MCAHSSEDIPAGGPRAALPALLQDPTPRPQPLKPAAHWDHGRCMYTVILHVQIEWIRHTEEECASGRGSNAFC